MIAATEPEPAGDGGVIVSFPLQPASRPATAARARSPVRTAQLFRSDRGPVTDAPDPAGSVAPWPSFTEHSTPSKLAALTAWLPRQPWAAALDTSALEQVGAFRLDDPAGAVGIETLLVRTADGVLLQVPLTYRAAPPDGAADALVATMAHSVLGDRWAYDGCADPVAVRELARAVLTGGHEAVLEVDTGAGRQRREPTMRVSGSGSSGGAVPVVEAVSRTDSATATTVDAGGVVLTIRRRLDTDPAGAGAETLTGTWPGNDTPTVLVTVR